MWGQEIGPEDEERGDRAWGWGTTCEIDSKRKQEGCDVERRQGRITDNFSRELT